MILPEAAARLVRDAESRLGVHFHEPTWLVEALTHRSYLNEQTDFLTRSNERLEFLGDAVLGFLIARYVFERYPDLSEGELTGRRAALIRTSTLAHWARDFDLAAVMRLGAGEWAGGPIGDNILADAFEAVLGAILLDQGLAAVEAFLMALLARQTDAFVEQAATQNYKGLLQEIAQEREHITPVYRTLSVEGPDHDSVFTVEVVVGERSLGTGTGRSKQAAQQAAARAALSHYASPPADEEEEA